MPTHFIHGFAVESDLVTGHDRPNGSPRPTLTVRFGGRRPVPGRVAEGAVLQSLAATRSVGMLNSTVRRDDGSILLRLHGHADFEISPELHDVVVWADPDSCLELTRIFVTGHLMAIQLMLRSALVLHASAVDLGGRVVAFVGNSGAGKSTMAALTCGRGATFVTDDVLRVDVDGLPRCWLGSTENRLRFDLSRHSPDHLDVSTSSSVDGRTVWTPEVSNCELSPLHAVVLPFPDHGIAQPELERLDPVEAILELSRRPRIQGWQDPVGRRALFANLAKLTAQVPVFRAHVPWGPPFSPWVADVLLNELGLPTVVRG